MKYVLITPARNEEAFIEKTLESVSSQTALPERWVVVDDGSTDRTAAIVECYARQFPWIELIKRPARIERTFAGKADAFHVGFERIRSLQFDVIGNCDADVSCDSDYFEFLLAKFEESPTLGVAGTAIVERNFHAVRDSFYSDSDVAGNCQLFRLACFLDIGGYTRSRWGGIDWIAVRTARMKGWDTRSFTEKLLYHHRTMGTAEGGILKARFDYGRKDYFLGNHPLWQVLRVAYQLTRRPALVGGLALLAGYLYAYLSRIERPISPELLAFHRTEQLSRLRRLVTGIVRSGGRG